MFLKTCFTPPQALANGIEIISIPTYSAPGEWQGTLIAYKYDAAGNFLSQWVSDVIMIPDATYTFWDVIYEVSFEDGNAYLEYGDPNLYDDLGGPIGGGSGGPITSTFPRDPTFQKATSSPQPSRLSGREIYPDPENETSGEMFGHRLRFGGGGFWSREYILRGGSIRALSVGGCVTGIAGCIGYSVFGN